MMPLYFPEDKTEYIIPGIVCVLFLVGAVATWRIFIKSSEREAENLKEMEKRIMGQEKR
ncbi:MULTISPECIES: hypothetical protein [Bacillus]|uniref:hypothetical protein n=1 Tax=Bacillus TaxID=1386 RepID=UPI001596D713|nr:MULTISPECIES: hypothetical protein [unclassified Bacillus (in: firmicutes)]MCP1125783.1 hypothetical protein [Bacillus sp. 3103sda1]